MRRRVGHHIPGAPADASGVRFLPCDPMPIPEPNRTPPSGVPFSPWRSLIRFQAETGCCAAPVRPRSLGRSVRDRCRTPTARSGRSIGSGIIQPDPLMLVDIGSRRSTVNASPGRGERRDPCRSPRQRPRSQIGRRVGGPKVTSSSASSHLLRSWRASSVACARRQRSCILDPVLGRYRRVSSKRHSLVPAQGREDTHLRIVHLTQPAVPHTGQTGVPFPFLQRHFHRESALPARHRAAHPPECYFTG